MADPDHLTRAVVFKAAPQAGRGSELGARVGALVAVLEAPNRPVTKEDGRQVAEQPKAALTDWRTVDSPVKAVQDATSLVNRSRRPMEGINTLLLRARGPLTYPSRGRSRTALSVLGEVRVAPRGVVSDAAVTREARGRHCPGAGERGGDHDPDHLNLLELGFVHDRDDHRAWGVCGCSFPAQGPRGQVGVGEKDLAGACSGVIGDHARKGARACSYLDQAGPGASTRARRRHSSELGHLPFLQRAGAPG